MTIRTHKNALVQFRNNGFPRFRHSANSEIFLFWIKMVKSQSLNTFVVAALFAFATFVFNGFDFGTFTPVDYFLTVGFSPIVFFVVR